MRLSREGRRPVYKGRSRIRLLEISVSPVELFAPLANRNGSIFLDSALVDRFGLGRWSFILFDPIFTFSSRGDDVVLQIGRRLKWEQVNPFVSLRRSLSLFSVAGNPSWIPFRGGAAGFLSYELGRRIERLPAGVKDDLELPEACLGFYDTVLAHDHIMDQWFICHTDFGLKRPDLEARMREVKLQVAKARKIREIEEIEIRTGPLGSNFERDQYLQAIKRPNAISRPETSTRSTSPSASRPRSSRATHGTFTSGSGRTMPLPSRPFSSSGLSRFFPARRRGSF